MSSREKGKKILILGGSGFIGNALYKELRGYFDTYGTYCTNPTFRDNQQFYPYNMVEDDVFPILEKIKPDIIISAVRGDFAAQLIAHQHLVEYVSENDAKILFISSANVFDAYSKFPSYEYDKTLSGSIYGKLKIRIENMLMRIPQEKMAILRVSMVFGNASPRLKEIRTALQDNEPIEVFPNLITNVIDDDKLSQQIHYIINQNLYGIYHLGSKDLVHHEDFIKETIQNLGNFHPILKKVYTSNDDRYLAALPKNHLLPKNLQFGYQEVIDHHLPIE